MAMQFSASIKDFADRTKRRADEVVRESMRLFYLDVVNGAPRLSGYLRASVKLSKGAPIPLEAKPPEPGGTYTVNVAANFAAIADARAGDTLFLSITASYAPHVIYGTSRQAATMFPQLSAMRWPAIVAQAAAKVRSGGGSGS
ncbi:hypothetical protein LRS73_35410 (plasmid) [Methylobacterium currus]|uniref:hypothetical protein n=1 Tax=Methylobacterium currus TaxID=2051553 RepID=UPI001E58AA6E|nr:hypothetical protein [Methylobacterium currus]UHC20467.1 hypothetical protein LRS73_35410 [Methylobacterium currus]